MRRSAAVLVLLTLITGCRAPAIPPEPAPREYAVYHGWLEQMADSLPWQARIVVSGSTLSLDQGKLQYKACLPERMRAIFDNAPPVTLSGATASHWLTLPDGRFGTLLPPGSPLPTGQPVEVLSLSRVAFTFSGYDAFLWVDRRRCSSDGGRDSCEGTEGHLYRGKRSGSDWSFTETLCQAATLPESEAPQPGQL